MKGKGTPEAGSREAITAMFTIACVMTMVVMPTASKLPSESFARKAIRYPRYANTI